MPDITEVRLYDGDYDREVEVADGITLLHYPPTAASPGWAVRHACPGTHRDLIHERIIVAPMITRHDIVSTDPLTVTPSILCNGAANPCGLHGFVTDGRWVDAGTPPDTMAHVRGTRST